MAAAGAGAGAPVVGLRAAGFACFFGGAFFGGALAGALAAVFVDFPYHFDRVPALVARAAGAGAAAVGPGATPWSSRKAVVTGPKDFQFASASGVA